MESQNNPSKEEIQKKLLELIASDLNIHEHTVHFDKDIHDYGIYSLSSQFIISEMEVFLKQDLPASLLYDYTTINEISSFLVEYINTGKE